ncbi:hypothetical protein J6590_051945 [Homalodisca vitripennis]|nr:hypothetical protein J6590_051945 [Homalodisca vitripennis]
MGPRKPEKRQWHYTEWTQHMGLEVSEVVVYTMQSCEFRLSAKSPRKPEKRQWHYTEWTQHMGLEVSEVVVYTMQSCELRLSA